MSSISSCLSSSSLKFRHNICFSRNSLPNNKQLDLSLRLRNPRIRLRFRVRVVRASSINVPSPIKPGGVVESDYLPSDIRKRSMDAIDSLGGRVTIGDVAAKAGLKLTQAQKALQALAADTNGFLEVSDEGDVLYVFPNDYRSKLVAKSLRMKIEPWAEKAKSAAEYLIRVSFGTTLIASIVIVFTAIIAIATSAESNRESNSNSRRRRGDSFINLDFALYNTRDLFWYWDRDYYRRGPRRTDKQGMNFLESVFSYVFGDGDPNQGIEEERWKMIGQYITSNGGVVTADELAPYLDVYTKDKNDDSYILPVLLRFDGQPEVDEEGNILYRFPSLQRTASFNRTGKKEYVGTRWSDWDGRVQEFFEEKKLQFSKTNVADRAAVIGLGALNFFGVIVLSTLLKDMAVKPNGFISFAESLLPLLQVYAGSFFAIPLVRWLFILKTNTEIEKRNQLRKLRAQALVSPDLSLKRKLLSARDMAQRTVIGKDRIVYSTEKGLDEQDYEEQEWERRFELLERAD
ncbi:uncharacterized protein At5g03900, chloroplastic [Silene latifolia]|uniref:uncharacterized protein At5g03900, chloroplastic n=1 Tax=Silene latifolia TaxID=37657 RepID=UPI003D77FA25